MKNIQLLHQSKKNWYHRPTDQRPYDFGSRKRKTKCKNMRAWLFLISRRGGDLISHFPTLGCARRPISPGTVAGPGRGTRKKGNLAAARDCVFRFRYLHEYSWRRRLGRVIKIGPNYVFTLRPAGIIPLIGQMLRWAFMGLEAPWLRLMVRVDFMVHCSFPWKVVSVRTRDGFSFVWSF